jgi:DNA repair protein RadC
MQPPKYVAKEFKLTTLRDCLLTEESHLCDIPEKAAEYWRKHVVSIPYFNPECECLVVLLLNTHRYVKGHHLVSIGTLDTVLVHPREVFRVAVMAGAAAIIVMHNHPSGDPTPSDSDVKATRDLIRAGQLIKIDLLDHLVIGRATAERPKDWLSLRELGYFYG